MNSIKFIIFLTFLAVCTLIRTSEAGEVRKIQDNSFLIEEAYNQEAGVVQHIQTFQLMEEGEWSYSFTQEWPAMDQRNQLSYVIPVIHIEEGDEETEIGDISLNYRYQAIMKDGIALSPRLTVLLPTGDYKKGMGSGATGYQVNMPLSVELTDKYVTHWNMGLTYTPGMKEPGGETADTVGFSYGASVIYLLSENLNLMLEAAWSSAEGVDALGNKGRSDSFIISPGIRSAIDFDNGLQVVPGLSALLGTGPSEGEYGMFFYLSLEHPFRKIQ